MSYKFDILYIIQGLENLSMRCDMPKRTLRAGRPDSLDGNAAVPGRRLRVALRRARRAHRRAPRHGPRRLRLACARAARGLLPGRAGRPGGVFLPSRTSRSLMRYAIPGPPIIVSVARKSLCFHFFATVRCSTCLGPFLTGASATEWYCHPHSLPCAVSAGRRRMMTWRTGMLTRQPSRGARASPPPAAAPTATLLRPPPMASLLSASCPLLLQMHAAPMFGLVAGTLSHDMHVPTPPI